MLSAPTTKSSYRPAIARLRDGGRQSRARRRHRGAGAVRTIGKIIGVDLLDPDLCRHADGTFDPTAVYAGAIQLGSTPTISYVANNVDLSYGNTFIDLARPPGASQNQQNVINGINSGILAGDAVPAAFQQLTNLSGAALLNAYSKLDGENNSGASTSTFQLFNDFFNLLSDMALGTGGGGGNSPGNGG